MKKLAACLVVLLAMSILALTLTSNVSAQTQNVKILSYSEYYDNLGNLIIVGEIQNTGPNIIGNVTIYGLITISDGRQAQSGCLASARQLLPNQKASFYMEFNSASLSESSWYGLQITNIALNIRSAPTTSQYQYPDVVIISQTPAPQDGVYWVNCELKNNGTQTATNIIVYGTFYNSTGSVVATGDTVNPISSLAPQATTSIRVPAFDLNQSIIPDGMKISSFRLLVQVNAPLLTGAAPVVNPDTTPVNVSPAPTNTSDGNGENATNSIYAIVIVVAVVAVAAAVFLVKRKKPKKPAQTPATEPTKPAKTRRRRKK